MTKSVAPTRRRGSDKRDRLVAAATQLLLEQGIERTTLADVAAAADGAGAAVGAPDGLAAQLLSGQAKDPDIPEIEQSSGPAAAMRPPAVVANRTVTIAAEDKASIERIDVLLSQSRSAPAALDGSRPVPDVRRLHGTFQW